MDKPMPHNSDWPVRWVENKNFSPPQLQNRKSFTVDQSSGNRRGNEQVYLTDPLKTCQEALQEAMKGFPSHGCQERSSSQVRSKNRGTGVQVVDPKPPAPQEQ